MRLGMESMRAEPPQRPGDWAQAEFKLAGESSHQKGAWEAWAFQVGILDFMSDDRIVELDVVKAKRVGYTKMITAFVCYNIAHRRRKQALWQPTDDDRDNYVKTEIDPLLDPLTGVTSINKARKRARARPRKPSSSSHSGTACCTCWAARLRGRIDALPWPLSSWMRSPSLIEASRRLALPWPGARSSGGLPIPSWSVAPRRCSRACAISRMPWKRPRAWCAFTSSARAVMLSTH